MFGPQGSGGSAVTVLAPGLISGQDRDPAVAAREEIAHQLGGPVDLPGAGQIGTLSAHTEPGVGEGPDAGLEVASAAAACRCRS